MSAKSFIRLELLSTHLFVVLVLQTSSRDHRRYGDTFLIRAGMSSSISFLFLCMITTSLSFGSDLNSSTNQGPIATQQRRSEMFISFC